jgi:hypothetical protein
VPTFPCSKCAKYWELRKPKRNGEGFTPLKKGYCLARTVFASNKPGENIYPPGARMADLPNGQHDVVIVRPDSLELSCTNAVPAKG